MVPAPWFSLVISLSLMTAVTEIDVFISLPRAKRANSSSQIRLLIYGCFPFLLTVSLSSIGVVEGPPDVPDKGRLLRCGFNHHIHPILIIPALPGGWSPLHYWHSRPRALLFLILHKPHVKLILCLLHPAASVCGFIFILKQHENSIVNVQLLFFSSEDKTTTGLKF